MRARLEALERRMDHWEAGRGVDAGPPTGGALATPPGWQASLAAFGVFDDDEA